MMIRKHFNVLLFLSYQIVASISFYFGDPITSFISLLASGPQIHISQAPLFCDSDKTDARVARSLCVFLFFLFCAAAAILGLFFSPLSLPLSPVCLDAQRGVAGPSLTTGN